jgi:TPP-dependent pyruvate/acetoin dehydrogenase alpha subunit
MSDHTTADDAARYRTKEEVEAWKSKDPLLRLKLFMEKNRLWTEEYQKHVEEEAKTAVTVAVKLSESMAPPVPQDMFAYTYETMTLSQKHQARDF